MISSSNPTLNNLYALTNINENTKEFMCLHQNHLNASMPFYQKEPLHSKEIDVQKLLGQEALQFDPKDLKPKLLYLMAKADHTNTFPINSPFFSIQSFINRMLRESSANKQISDTIKKIIQHRKKADQGDQNSIEYLKAVEMGLNDSDHGIGRFLKSLNKNFDLRFKVISTAQEICEEISAASRINNFKSLIFSGHGTSNTIMISDSELILQDPENQKVLYSANYTNMNGMPVVNNISFQIDESCFSGLPSDATISLFSCNTGESPTGIASTISKVSQLDVWAPRNFITSVKTELSSDIPPIPTFWNARKYENSFFDDHACKFSPDGLSKCGALNTKVLPVVMDYAPLVILSLTALYCVKKYIKPWICRKICQVVKK